jgi:predicted nucleotidyltransferase
LVYTAGVSDSNLAVVEPLVEAIRTRVEGLAAVYLFGSRARGDALPDSDLDLAFLASQKMDPVLRWKLQEDLASLGHRDVDLVDLRQASTVMRVQVLRDAVLLLDLAPSARQAFEAFALGAYARLNLERRGILADVAARSRPHG